MRTLTDQEKRTIRIAGIGIGIYLLLFCGFKAWKFLDTKRADYLALVAQAQRLKVELLPYQEKAAAAKKLMENFHMDPAKLTRATLVGEASAAIQAAASGSGIQVGPIREAPGRPSSKELASMTFEGSGPVPAITGMLGRLETLGYPLVIDSVQITPDSPRPGQARLNLTIVILDFEQWKSEAPHA